MTETKEAAGGPPDAEHRPAFTPGSDVAGRPRGGAESS